MLPRINLPTECSEQCCGTCAFHKPMAGEWCCDNEDGEGYGLSTAYDDYCEEYKEREDD